MKGKGVPPAVIRRVFTKKILWMVRMDPAYVNRLFRGVNRLFTDGPGVRSYVDEERRRRAGKRREKPVAACSVRVT